MSDLKQGMGLDDPDSEKMNAIIRGLEKWHRDGDREAYEQVFVLVYEDLRTIAKHLHVRESRLEMSRATSIVGRLYERWLKGKPFTVSTQKELLQFARHAMKQLYTEKGRKVGNRRQLFEIVSTGDMIETDGGGSGKNRSDSEFAYQDLEIKLKAKNESWFKVWKLKSAGYTYKEIAAIIDKSEITTKRYYKAAETFLASVK